MNKRTMILLIPNIDSKIEGKLKELNLKPKVKPKDFVKKKGDKKHRYFSLCIDESGKEILFYARIHNNIDARDKFITEIKFLCLAGQQGMGNIAPQMFNYGIEKDFEWLAREELKPESLAQLSPRIISSVVSKNSDLLANYVFSISKVRANKVNFKSFDWSNHFKFPNFDCLVDKRIINKNLSNSLVSMTRNIAGDFKKNCHYLSHGDLTLENILSDKKDFWIIDWERTCFNNYAYDIAFLWMHLWNNHSGRKKLISSYIKKVNKNDFKLFFPTIVSYLAMGEVLMNFEKEKALDRTKRKSFCKQVLKYSVEDFNKLIRL